MLFLFPVLSSWDVSRVGDETFARGNPYELAPQYMASGPPFLCGTFLETRGDLGTTVVLVLVAPLSLPLGVGSLWLRCYVLLRTLQYNVEV